MWLFALRSSERPAKRIGDRWSGEDGGEASLMYTPLHFYHMSVDGRCW